MLNRLAQVLAVKLWLLSLALIAAEDRPNVVLIMADDLGYECLECYGGTSYKTPRLNELAANGTKFVNCFSTPKCSPSRVTLLTGRYTFRTTLKWGHIPANEITFGHVLSDAGYVTALTGKWQLGRIIDDPKRVQRFGFQESVVWGWHEGPRYWQPLVYRNDKLLRDVEDKFGPDIYCDALIDFIERHRDRPFLAYYPMCLTHFPKSNEPKPTGREHLSFGEMVAEMDRQVGKLIDALERLGLREKTVVLFTADNGSPTNVASRLGEKTVKGGKAKLTDAGTRVPLLVSWPGTTPVDRTNNDLIDFTDFLPTLAELTRSPLPSGVTIDGRSFAPQVRGKAGSPREWVFTEWSGQAWVRDKRWKLYRRGQLFDMQQDPLEKKSLPKDAALGNRARLQAVLDGLSQGVE